jgi:hypothetical protein
MENKRANLARQENSSPALHRVAVFQPYSFRVGQKIHLTGGPRQGDWEVIGVDKDKVKLRCPVSHREFEWQNFCYLVEEGEGIPWPRRD